MKAYHFGIIGGGLVGLTMALALSQLSLPIVVLEAFALPGTRKNKSEMGTIALSYASVAFYKKLGIWSELEKHAVPIEAVHVTMQGALGSTTFRDKELGCPYLGYVIGTDDIKHILYAALEQMPHCDIYSQARLDSATYDNKLWHIQSQAQKLKFTSKLLISAEGVNSCVRAQLNMSAVRTDYKHKALISNIQLSDNLAGVAVERFLKEGAMALLPWHDNLAVMILSGSEDQVSSLNNLSEPALLAHCQKQLGYQNGIIQKMGARVCVPLRMQLAEQHFYKQLIFLGNCVHSIHPIAAQGFNLSVRDIRRLLASIINHDLANPQYWGEILEDITQYVEATQRDQKNIILATDSIAKAVHAVPAPLKALGINIFEHMPFLKKQIAMLGMGLSV